MEPLSPVKFVQLILGVNLNALGVLCLLFLRYYRDPPDAPHRNIRYCKILTGVMVLLATGLWYRVWSLNTTSADLRLIILGLAMIANWMMYVPIIGWIEAVRLLRKRKQTEES